MTENKGPPPGFTYLEGGKLWPLDMYNNPMPTPLQVEQEKILKRTIAQVEASLRGPRKSFNTLERERIQDQANGIRRGR